MFFFVRAKNKFYFDLFLGFLENSQLSWVEKCFDFFTARFHYAMKPIVYADYGLWKIYMNTLDTKTEKMFFFVEIQKHKPAMESNSTTKCRQPPGMQIVYFSTLLGLCLRFLPLLHRYLYRPYLKSLYFLKFSSSLKSSQK